MSYTVLNPWVAWLSVLALHFQPVPVTSTYFIVSVVYSVCLTFARVSALVNKHIAYRWPRAVRLDAGKEGEVIVVTGGASGLGLLIVRAYALRGFRVAVLDVQQVENDDHYGRVCCYRCDVGNREQVESTRSRIEKDVGLCFIYLAALCSDFSQLGTPTVLINCAAARINGLPLLSLPAESVQRTIQTNLFAAFNTCQTFLPGMLAARNGGTIVTVSSVLGRLTPACLSDYSASKAGLSALHATLEAELCASAHDNKVKMILVEIGQMSTPLFERIKTPSEFFAPVLEPTQVAQEIVSAIDSGRGGIIRLPTFAALVNWYAVLPVSLQRMARSLSGIDLAVAKAT